MAIRRIGFMPPAGGDKPHPCIPGPLFPYRPERRRRYGVSPRRRKIIGRTARGKFQEGGIAIPPFLAVSRGGLLRLGKSGPQRLCREEGTITGARRRQDKKTDTKKFIWKMRQSGTRRADVGRR